MRYMLTIPGFADGELDELFGDAVKIIIQYDRASTPLLQRRLSVGYARAARIMDQLEAAGVVSQADGSKPREVLIQSYEEFLEKEGKPPQVRAKDELDFPANYKVPTSVMSLP
jgi:S-DNA-T family DNA segregation ATPase FtsK/SpoIIIE